MSGGAGSLVQDQNNRKYTGRMPKRDPRTQLRLNRVLGRAVVDDMATKAVVPPTVLLEVNQVLAENRTLKQEIPAVLQRTEQVSNRLDRLEGMLGQLLVALQPKVAPPLAGEATKAPEPPAPPAENPVAAAPARAPLGPTTPCGPTQPVGPKKAGARKPGSADLPPAEG